MQWPLTSQLHGSVSQREHLVFRYGSNSSVPVCTFFFLLKVETVQTAEKFGGKNVRSPFRENADAAQGCQMVYIFSNQKSQFGLILVGLAMERVGNFLWPFGLFCCYLVCFMVI
jgi:hypothetical protein